MKPETTRRSLLAGVAGLLGLGGCLSAGKAGSCGLSGGPPNSVHVLNTDLADRTVELTVFLDLLAYREVVYEDSVHLTGRRAETGNHEVLPEVVTRAGRHVLRVRVPETGERTDYLWKATTNGCNALVVSVEDGTPSVTKLNAGGSGTGGPP